MRGKTSDPRQLDTGRSRKYPDNSRLREYDDSFKKPEYQILSGISAVSYTHLSRLNESGLIAEYKRDETDLGEDVHIQIASFYPAILEEVKTLYAQTEDVYKRQAVDSP